MTSCLALHHHPAGSPHIPNDLFVKFLADFMDQDIDGIAFNFLSPAVNPLLNLRARKDDTRPLHESLHKREFSRREDMLYIPVLRLMRGKIEGDLAACNQ